MKTFTRILLVLLGLLGLTAGFLCGRHAYLNISTAGTFIDTLKELFNGINIIMTLIAIFSVIIGIKDLLVGIIKGKSIVVFFTGLVFAAAAIYVAIDAYKHALFTSWDIVAIIIVLGSCALMSFISGILSAVLKIKD